MVSSSSGRFWIVSVLLAVGLFSFVLCVNHRIADEESSREDFDDRSVRSYNDGYSREDWRAVDNRQDGDAPPSWSQDSDPHEKPEDQTPKRRRIRKRKRRPLVPAYNNPEDAEQVEPEETRLPRPPKYRRPQTLENDQEPWKEMEEEEYRPRIYNRRRTGPVFESGETEEESRSKPVVYEKVRDPYTALEETQTKRNFVPEVALTAGEATTTLATPSGSVRTPDLKTLLKQSGGSLSLSEILQQKNLSLSDLLKGKQQAIYALTDIPAVTATSSERNAEAEGGLSSNGNGKLNRPGGAHVYRRLPPSVKRKQNFNELFTTTTEKSTFREQLDAQRKRLAGISSHTKKMKPFHELTVTNLEVVTEATTERRVFIPVVSATHPKYYHPDIEEATKYLAPETTTTTTTEAPTAATTEYTEPNYPSTTKGSAYLIENSEKAPPSHSIMKPKLRLPVTSARLNKKVTTIPPRTETQTQETENYPKQFTIPPKAFKISLNELFASGEATSKDNETDSDEGTTRKQDETGTTKKYGKDSGPYKISLDIDELVRKITTERMEIQSQRYKTKNVLLSKQPSVLEAPVKKPTSNSYHEQSFQQTNQLEESKKVIPEKLKFVTAKDELMELLRDKESRKNLTKILEKRNMTVAELVAQRERGSSQVHLADIFHNDTKEPEPKEEPLIGQIMNDLAFRSFPTFERRGKLKTMPSGVEIKTDSEGSNYFTSVINLQQRSPSFDAEYSAENGHHLTKKNQPKDITVTSFPTYKIATDKKLGTALSDVEKAKKVQQLQIQQQITGNPVYPIPLWKTVYPPKYETNYPQTPQLEIKQLMMKDSELSRNEVELDEIETKMAEAVNEHLNFNKLADDLDDDDDYYQLPYGVRSAIIASSVIVGVSLFIFITIFVIFKWSQRQRKRLCYGGAYSGSKIRSPILETGYTKRGGISTIMNATLGRKKTFSRGDKQSMSDYLWESDKKPFQ